MQSVTSAPLILRAGERWSLACRPWAFEANVAHLVLYNQTRLPTPSDILGWVRATAHGSDTTPSAPARSAPQAGARFERLGFEPIQSLVLLEHTRARLGQRPHPTGSTPAVRLASSADGEASRVDVAAFGPGWCIDRIGISDVRSATPRHRARAMQIGGEHHCVHRSPDGTAGTVTSNASPVSPDHQHRGHGSTLVTDALRWMARWRVQRRARQHARRQRCRAGAVPPARLHRSRRSTPRLRTADRVNPRRGLLTLFGLICTSFVALVPTPANAAQSDLLLIIPELQHRRRRGPDSDGGAAGESRRAPTCRRRCSR